MDEEKEKDGIDWRREKTYIFAPLPRKPDAMHHQLQRDLHLKHHDVRLLGHQIPHHHLLPLLSFLLDSKCVVRPRVKQDPVLPTPFLDNNIRRPRLLPLYGLDVASVDAFFL